MYNDLDFYRSYLTPDEYVLWQGAPQGGHIFTPQDAFMIPFSLVWCGFAVFWTVGAIQSAGMFGFFGIPFMLMGLYLVFGRFLHRINTRKKTAYVITNQKIIRKQGNRVDIKRLSDLPEMQVLTYKNGCGNITFGYEVTHYRGRYYRSSAIEDYRFSLENIPDVMRVQRLILDAQSNMQ